MKRDLLSSYCKRIHALSELLIEDRGLNCSCSLVEFVLRDRAYRCFRIYMRGDLGMSEGEFKVLLEEKSVELEFEMKYGIPFEVVVVSKDPVMSDQFFPKP